MKLSIDQEVPLNLTVWQIARLLDAIERNVALHPSEVVIITERLRVAVEKAEEASK